MLAPAKKDGRSGSKAVTWMWNSEICYAAIAVHLSNQASAKEVIHNSMMDFDKTSPYEAIQNSVTLTSIGDEKEVS